MKVGDLVVHDKGTVYPQKYLLGIIINKSLEFETLYEVVWFHSARKQLCRYDVIKRLEDYESR
jgi:hypothetical protein